MSHTVSTSIRVNTNLGKHSDIFAQLFTELRKSSIRLKGKMKVSFRNKYRDLIAFNFRHTFHSLLFLGSFVFIIVIGIKPNWQSVNHIAADESLSFRLVFFVILELVPVVFVYLITALVLLLSNIGKMNKTVLTDCTITLGDDVIITESAYSYSEVQWTAIQKLVRTRSHIFLYVIQHGALVIPKRAFDSDEACDRFWSACQAKVNP